MSSFYRTFRLPTRAGVRFQSQSKRRDLERTRRGMPPAAWNQEYECIPTEKENAAFRQEDLYASMAGETASRASPALRCIVAADLGGVRDPSAWVAIRATPVKDFGVPDRPQPRVLAAEIRPLREPHHAFARDLARIARRYGDALTLIDATGGATGGRKPHDTHLKLYRSLVPNLREYYITPTNKEGIVNDLDTALQNRWLQIPRTLVKLHEQLASYEYTYHRSSNRYEYHGPEGHDDDLVMALVIGWQAVVRGWSVQHGAGLDSVV